MYLIFDLGSGIKHSESGLVSFFCMLHASCC